MDFEPVRAAPVARAMLRHSNREALLQSARLARGSILFVDYALVVVLALADGRAIIIRPPKERLASFACERAEVVAGRNFAAHSTALIHFATMI